MVEGRNAFKKLTSRHAGKRPLGRWEDNIRMYLKEISNNSKNWVDLAQDRVYSRALVNAALNRRVPYAMPLVT